MSNQTEMESVADYVARRGTPAWRRHVVKPFGLLSQIWLGWRWRTRFLRWGGVKIGLAFVGRNCIFDQDYPELITIEDGVTISTGVIVMAHDAHRQVVGPILLARKSFVGAGAIILPGVTIGTKAVVGAGSVVTRSVPDGVTVVGSPARPLLK